MKTNVKTKCTSIVVCGLLFANEDGYHYEWIHKLMQERDHQEFPWHTCIIFVAKKFNKSLIY